MADKLIIFDTTLRDGEQSPGASMNLNEKLEIARTLEALGVDVIEAGFPIASPDDFAAVQAIARQCTRARVCGLARSLKGDIDRAAEAVTAGGGKIVNGPMEIPGGEYALNAVDPHDAHIGFVGPRKQ